MRGWRIQTPRKLDGNKSKAVQRDSNKSKDERTQQMEKSATQKQTQGVQAHDKSNDPKERWKETPPEGIGSNAHTRDVAEDERAHRRLNEAGALISARGDEKQRLHCAGKGLKMWGVGGAELSKAEGIKRHQLATAEQRIREGRNADRNDEPASTRWLAAASRLYGDQTTRRRPSRAWGATKATAGRRARPTTDGSGPYDAGKAARDSVPTAGGRTSEAAQRGGAGRRAGSAGATA
ncbi:uncharacterized protein A4U43_C01F17550 [Asparagus officinalis]|uniref:Uncharacterized protein n=1 Tax=Asparagus officinalis TaxID=4686 RepID=A0A5P1FUP9_ASPOF|nr:uncharacterized protein A4U43_C01F17550 [Asparagus officinalis]